MYLSITGATPDNKLAKYQPFEVEAEATDHSSTYGGFAVTDPGGDQEFWLVDMVAKTITQDTTTEASVTITRNAQAAIATLEATITPRRMREHALGTGGTWLADVDALIAIERAKL